MKRIDTLSKQIIQDNNAIELKTQIIKNGASYFHNHDYYEIFYMISGTVSHYFDNKTEIIRAGDLFYIPPGYVHCFYKSDSEYMHRDIMVSKKLWNDTCAFLHLSQLSKYFPTKIVLTNEQIIELEDLINSFNKKNLDYGAIEENPYAYLIVIQIIKHLTDSNNNKLDNINPTWVITLIDKLSLPENLCKSKKELLSQFTYSQAHMCRAFKRYTGQTLTDYMNNKRMDYAAVLLATTNKTIKEIIYDCGFESTPYFIKKFKQKFKISPASFRKKQLKGN